tara:strand:- start:1248 stop:2405 length:1158 start_codon:yes stop_codon:yes gene_type:complete
MDISIKQTEPGPLNTIKNEVITIKYNKDDDFYPDNYYKYNLNGVLNTDFSSLQTTPKTFIYVSCFRVIESKNNKIIQNPFLQYLLFKYPSSNSSYSNLTIFPFRILGNDTVKQCGKKIMNDLNYKTVDCLGYIKNRRGVYLFYEIPYKKYKVNLLKKNSQLWWTTIHEICNLKKILSFPIHKSVSKLFFDNNQLLFLKNKKNNNIEIPTVGFYTETKELLPYISIMGIKSSSSRTFGPYYYFDNLQNAFRGSWSSNYKKREIQNKVITDQNGLLKSPGFVRFVIFTGKPRVPLYRPTDPFYNYIKFLDTSNQIKGKNIAKIKWAQKYDSIIISNFKFKNIEGYFQTNTKYIVKSFDSFTSLSYHLIDKKTIKPVWDPFFDGYSII